MPPHDYHRSIDVTTEELCNPLQSMEMEAESDSSIIISCCLDDPYSGKVLVVSDNEEFENIIPRMSRMKSSFQMTTSIPNNNNSRNIISTSASAVTTSQLSEDESLMQEVPLSPVSSSSVSTCVKSKCDSEMDAFCSARRQVSFSKLHVREYNVVFGDHPCCMSGPPLTLGWNHESEDVLSLEEYESSRKPRKARKDLRMTCEHRRQILLLDQTERDLQHEERRLFRERQRSRKTCSTQDFFVIPSPTENNMELLSVSRSGIFDAH